MRLFHLCQAHWGSGKPTGVPRFSRHFKQAFPQVLDITPADIGRCALGSSDVVVADNHLTLLIPRGIHTIGVHHGCAQTHYDRDHSWRSGWSKSLCNQQKEMFNRPGRKWVAPSGWVADQFAQIARPHPYDPVIVPHWVEPIRGMRAQNPRPVIIGDWRGPNKGAPVIEHLRRACPQWEFRQLDFPADNDAARRRAYLDGDVYLCLSYSEGAPYSVADAEAADLPIVTTPVGNWMEFKNVYLIDREERKSIAQRIEQALACKPVPGFYREWTFEKWKAAWTTVITRWSK